jgi:hypothetical protein
MSATYFFMGAFITFFGLFIVGGFATLIYLINQSAFNRLIRITNWTAGKPYVEWYWAKKQKHPELGDVYFVPKLKRDKRQYIPYFGSDKKYPTNRNKKMYVPVTYYNGIYVPESYDPSSEQEIEVIESHTEIDAKGKEITTFKKTKKKLSIFISKTIPQSNRMFYLKSDVEIEREFAKNDGWWSKYGTTVISIAMLLITAVVCAVMIIFSYETTGKILSNATPSWVQTLIDAIQGGQAPPAP